MRASAPNGFDIWEAVDGLRETFAASVGRRGGPGDIRTAILVALADEPKNGYEVIQSIETRTGGAWSPSPGTVYPTLQLLTETGRALAAEAAELDAPGESGRARAEPNLALPKAGVKLAQAASQVAQN